MAQLSIWTDITTITQRYLNLLHGMTRIDQHPRQLHKGKNIHEIISTYIKDWTKNSISKYFTGLGNKICYFIKDSIQNIRNRFIQLFNNLIRTKMTKYSFIVVCLVIVVVIIGLTVHLWPSTNNKGTKWIFSFKHEDS